MNKFIILESHFVAKLDDAQKPSNIVTGPFGAWSDAYSETEKLGPEHIVLSTLNRYIINH